MIPELANVFVLRFAGNQSYKLYTALLSEIKKDDNYSKLELVHHLTSGQKAAYTDLVWKSIEKLRQNCGGAGFQANSGLTEDIINYSPAVTYEGVTPLMTFQSARLLIKTLKGIHRGSTAPYPFEYLNKIDTKLSSGIKKVEDLYNLDRVQEALYQRSRLTAIRTLEAFGKHHGKKQADLINEELSQEVTDMTRAHLWAMSLRQARDELKHANFQDQNTVKNIETLFLVWGLSQLKENSLVLFEYGYLARGQSVLILDALKHKIREIRPQLIPLVEC